MAGSSNHIDISTNFNYREMIVKFAWFFAFILIIAHALSYEYKNKNKRKNIRI
jgi:hypothetical protein